MKTLPRYITTNMSLAHCTTYGIGGPAAYFSVPTTVEEVAETYAFARSVGLPVLVLGGGSNLLVADSGVEAVILRLDASAFSAVSPDADDPLLWRVGAAAGLAPVVEQSALAGLRGLEPFAGIPGRIGGAAAMNAGGADSGIGALIQAAEAFDGDGAQVVLRGDELAFRYRGSALLGMTAIRLTLRFPERDDAPAVLDAVATVRARKRATQPLGFPSAGCVFTNPPGHSAGALLDRSGCKGMREGGAEVSAIHANFIINRGGATSGDIARLALSMRERVMSTAGVRLQPEIRLWGSDPAFVELSGNRGLHDE